MICQSKFVFVNYQDPQHSHVFFESLTNPFPTQKSCQSSNIVVMKGFPNLTTQMKLLPLLTLNYTALVFQCSTDLQHKKGTAPRNTAFKRLTPL